MSHTYARNYVHLIFSTRERHRKLLAPIRPDLWAYMGGIAREYGIHMLAIGGTEDHMHILIGLPPKLSLAHAMRAIKANSSKWMNENGHLFAWQEGYAAFSVSVSNLANVTKYIENQAVHHAKKSFEEEFCGFLVRNGIEFDSKYVFG
ncbi:MAG TPA: IS200/IS605 family transposase [Terriglobales bacterium]|nr:IS200/IS605 family transposase [Terriglobales bacterium]